MRSRTFIELQAKLSEAVPRQIGEFTRLPLMEVWARTAPYGGILEREGRLLPLRPLRATIPAWGPLVAVLAALAFRPEGVSFAGLHWQVTHPDEAGSPWERSRQREEVAR